MTRTELCCSAQWDTRLTEGQWQSHTEPAYTWHQGGTILLQRNTYLVFVVCGDVDGILKWERLMAGGLGSIIKEEKRKSRE